MLTTKSRWQLANTFDGELYPEKSRIIFRYLIKIGCLKEDAEDILQNYD